MSPSTALVLGTGGLGTALAHALSETGKNHTPPSIVNT
jgi:shikimate 5-dehydrogenase